MGGASPCQYIIVDEAPNLTLHEVKTIVSRVGEGTKIVLTGDVGQINNPYLDTSSNGLSLSGRAAQGAAHCRPCHPDPQRALTTGFSRS